MLDFGFKKSAIDAFTGGKEKKNEIFIIRDIEKRKGRERFHDGISSSSNFPSSGKTSIKLARVHSPMGGCLADESLMDTMDLSGTTKLA